MNLKRLPLFALVTLALAGCGSGGAKEGQTPTDSGPKPDATGGPVTLRLKPVVGAKYKVEETSESNGKTAVMFIDREVKSVTDQSVKLESAVSDVQGDALLVIGLKMQTELTPRYEVRGNSTLSANPEFKQVAANVLTAMRMAPVFPENAVKPGDTWKSSFPLDTMFMSAPDVKVVGDPNIPLDCTFVGIRDEGGKKLAVVEMKCDVKSSVKIKDQTQKLGLFLTGEFRYDVETGMLMYSLLDKSTASENETSSLKTTTKVQAVK